MIVTSIDVLKVSQMIPLFLFVDFLDILWITCQRFIWVNKWTLRFPDLSVFSFLWFHCELSFNIIIPRRKISGEILFCLSVYPSVRFFCPDAYLCSGFLDFIVILQEYELALHMRTAHTKFGCTSPTGNRVMALCYFQIYIVNR